MTCHFKLPIASIPLCLAMMRSIPPCINYSIYLSEHRLINMALSARCTWSHNSTTSYNPT